MRQALLLTILALFVPGCGASAEDRSPVGGTPTPARSPAAAKVLDRLEKLLSGLKDLSAEVQVQTARRQVPGRIALAYVGEGRERTRKYRVETRTTADGRALGVTQVCDGKYLYVEVRDIAAGTTTATRRRLHEGEAEPGQLGVDWRDRIAEYRKRYTFRTLGLGQFAEEEVAVVLAEEDTGHGKRPKLMMMVSTDDGFPRRVTVYADERSTGSASMTVTFSKVKLNTGLPLGTFRYEAPAGVEVRDVQ
jgi:outer membrane lipoprotein-sorting protein